MTVQPDRHGHEHGQRHGIRPRGLALTLGVAALVIAADQISKALIVNRLGPSGDPHVVEVIPRLLRFIYVENSGAAFGIFQGGGSILTPLAVGVVLVLAVVFRHMVTQSLWLSIALGLQFGGALGNIVDRLHYGYVIDFINVPHWPTFNLSDSAITVGVIILGCYLLFRPFPEADSHERDAAVAGTSAPPPAGGEEGGTGAPSESGS